MRVERPEAIEALKQYLLSNTAYPFLVAANSSADLKALTRSPNASAYYQYERLLHR